MYFLKYLQSLWFGLNGKQEKSRQERRILVEPTTPEKSQCAPNYNQIMFDLLKLPNMLTATPSSGTIFSPSEVVLVSGKMTKYIL